MIQRSTVLLLILAHLVFAQRFGQIIADEEDRQEPGMEIINKSKPQEAVVLEGRIDPDHYIVGPGDQFAVNIQFAESVYLTLTVTPNGQLLIPNVGAIEVAGQTLSKVLRLIEGACQQSYQKARISMDLIGIRSYRVSMTGAINTPGFFTVNAATRLVDLLSQVEPNPLAKDYAIQITSKSGYLNIVNPYSYLTKGDLSQNPVLQEGDKIHIPFGSFEESGIVVRGAVALQGYDLILPGETLAEYIKRKVFFQRNLDIYGVKVVRRTQTGIEIISMMPNQFTDFVLLPGDDIEFLNEKPVSVLGYVGSPGSFMYIPGYTAGDYIAKAGGLTASGTFSRVKIVRANGDVVSGKDQIIQRGDIIEVKRSVMHFLFGEITMLQFVNTTAALLLTFIATSR